MNSQKENIGLARFVKNTYRAAQQSDNDLEIVNRLLAELADFISAGVFLCRADGKLIAKKNITSLSAFVNNKEPSGELFINGKILSVINSLVDPTWNLPFRRFIEGLDLIAALVPAIYKMERYGTLVLFKKTEFDATQQSAAEVTVAVAAPVLCVHSLTATRRKSDHAGIVKASLDTLSYSELTAAIEIFKELSGHEGCVVASRIAKRSGITRSAIVNALRKLESAAIVESRSLGVKGTYIKVINHALLSELDKFCR